ncbi:MAG: hypothetical protein HY646_20305, partial [Acidobacteria bacterium]|nr:hypothetical protein [Acidobacteriota bacterium]
AWSVSRSHPGFGKVVSLTTNTVGGEANDQYTSFETSFNKRHAKGWSLLAGFTTDFRDIGNETPQTPNNLVYNWQFPEQNYSLKMSGTYDLPWSLKYAGTYTAQSGQYYGRTTQMRDALNSLVNVQVEDHVGRYPWVKLWDNRISKTFNIGDRMSVEAIGELFNTLNTNAVLTQTNTNGPIYLRPNTIVPPRVFRMGAKFRF